MAPIQEITQIDVLLDFNFLALHHSKISFLIILIFSVQITKMFITITRTITPMTHQPRIKSLLSLVSGSANMKKNTPMTMSMASLIFINTLLIVSMYGLITRWYAKMGIHMSMKVNACRMGTGPRKTIMHPYSILLVMK